MTLKGAPESATRSGLNCIPHFVTIVPPNVAWFLISNDAGPYSPALLYGFAKNAPTPKPWLVIGLGTFERYLSGWVALCMVAGVVIGKPARHRVRQRRPDQPAHCCADLAHDYAVQADIITGRFFHVVLIAVPTTLQVYFNAAWLTAS